MKCDRPPAGKENDMKVKDIVKKINYGRMKQDVFVRTGFEEPRKLESFDFGDYYYDEKERTVTSIDIEEDRIIINYK